MRSGVNLSSRDGTPTLTAFTAPRGGVSTLRAAGRALMATLQDITEGLSDIGRDSLRTSLDWTTSWWHVIYAGALVLVLAMSPSTYQRSARASLARQLYLGTAPLLPWFALLAALFSVVIIRIVVVTAVSYGLTQYALEMMIRVLVLELIPLSAALFVALRATLP